LAQLRQGLETALSQDADYIVVHPVEMPAVRTQTLKALFEKLKGELNGDGVRPRFEGAPGFPLALTRAAAERLRRSTAPTLGQALSSLELTPFPTKDPGVLVSIQSAETYARLFGTAPKLAAPPRHRAHRESA
jgi:molybdenum cofactor cytidylyltransferase